VLNSENLSKSFGLSLSVERDGGRYFARAV
jgi:hypothetical protein